MKNISVLCGAIYLTLSTIILYICRQSHEWEAKGRRPRFRVTHKSYSEEQGHV